MDDENEREGSKTASKENFFPFHSREEEPTCQPRQNELVEKAGALMAIDMFNSFYLCPQMASEPPLSYYAVFDGHAGKDAAAFAASHLHTVR